MGQLQTFHMAYSSQNHVTRSYNCTPFSHYIDENSGMGQFINEHLKLKIWDTWGMATRTYTELTLMPFLKGQVWDTTEMVENETTQVKQAQSLIRQPDHLR